MLHGTNRKNLNPFGDTVGNSTSSNFLKLSSHVCRMTCTKHFCMAFVITNLETNFNVTLIDNK